VSIRLNADRKILSLKAFQQLLLTVEMASVAPVVPASYRVTYGAVGLCLWVHHDDVVQLGDLVVARVSTILVSLMVPVHHRHHHRNLCLPYTDSVNNNIFKNAKRELT